MFQETTLLQTNLKDQELRELQLFISQSPILYPYLNKFAAENISKDLLLQSDNLFLKLISETFNMKLGEYGALCFLIKNQTEKDLSSNSKSKEKVFLESNTQNLLLNSASTSTRQRGAELFQNQNQNDKSEVIQEIQEVKEETKEKEERSENGILSSKRKFKGPDEIENEEVDYKDNTNKEFKIGNIFL